jgi:hypothetical protein
VDDRRLHWFRRARDERSKRSLGRCTRAQSSAVLEVGVRVDPNAECAAWGDEPGDRSECPARRERVVQDAVAVDDVKLEARERQREQ